MAKKKKEPASRPEPVEEKQPVKINVSQYRSMVLSKLRSDIEAKRVAYELAKVMSPEDLLNMKYWKMKYWKMKYWKMKYWKMGSVELPGTEISNPAGKAPQK